MSVRIYFMVAAGASLASAWLPSLRARAQAALAPGAPGERKRRLPRRQPAAVAPRRPLEARRRAPRAAGAGARAAARGHRVEGAETVARAPHRSRPIPSRPSAPPAPSRRALWSRTLLGIDDATRSAISHQARRRHDEGESRLRSPPRAAARDGPGGGSHPGEFHQPRHGRRRRAALPPDLHLHLARPEPPVGGDARAGQRRGDERLRRERRLVDEHRWPLRDELLRLDRPALLLLAGEHLPGERPPLCVGPQWDLPGRGTFSSSRTADGVESTGSGYPLPTTPTIFDSARQGQGHLGRL